MILLDCSEFMRNGDYVPTRLEAQVDAANLLAGAKTQAHPESTVGISSGHKVLLSPTDDVGKILSAIHTTKGSGGDFRSASMNGPLDLDPQPADVAVSVQVASLALKHRPNKNGSQRIVLFVGSPVEAEKKALQKAGRQLKKNNVAIDVVVLGELEENEPKLRELVDAANGRSDEGERTCHLVTIPAGVLPSDVLANSPILGAGGAFAGQAAVAMASGGGAGGGDAFADFGGVDPNMDPELAMALRISMEEERARQERAAAAANSGGGSGEDANMADANNASAAAADAGISEEEALLQQALAMSMNENEPASAEDSKPAASGGGDDMEMDEDEAMQMALQMSMQQEQQEGSGGGAGLQDPAFVNQLLGSAQGVDANDPEIQEALRKSKEEKDKKEESKKE